MVGTDVSVPQGGARGIFLLSLAKRERRADDPFMESAVPAFAAHPHASGEHLGGIHPQGSGGGVPGSSIRQATPPTGIWVRTPLLSTTTNAPSNTSSWPFSINRIESRFLMAMGLSGGRRSAIHRAISPADRTGQCRPWGSACGCSSIKGNGSALRWRPTDSLRGICLGVPCGSGEHSVRPVARFRCLC